MTTVQQLVEHLYTLNPDAIVCCKGHETYDYPLDIKTIEVATYQDQTHTPIEDVLLEKGQEYIVI